MQALERPTEQGGVLVGRDHVVQSLKQAVSGGEHGLLYVPALIKRVIREDCWRERCLEVTGEVVEFERFEQFVEMRTPEGLGADMATIKRLCRDDAEALDLIDQAVQSPVGRPETLYIIQDSKQEIAPTGTSAEAALRRLRKDAPELHRRVIGGELSPHAAMVEAGFRKRTIQIPSEPTKAAAALRRHFTPDELASLVSELADMIDWRR